MTALEQIAKSITEYHQPVNPQELEEEAEQPRRCFSISLRFFAEDEVGAGKTVGDDWIFLRHAHRDSICLPMKAYATNWIKRNRSSCTFALVELLLPPRAEIL